MFVRTDVGISSEHLFYDVEFVVYSEGPERNDDGATHDELFWSLLFGALGVRCKCKSVGGKSNVRPLAAKVAAGHLTRTIVTMDRDYDDLFGLMIDHPNVVYTYGYSWENDALLTIDAGLASALFFDVVDVAAIANELEAYLDGLTVTLRRTCFIDIAYFRCEGSLFDRDKPLAIINQRKGHPPSINISNVLAGTRRIGRVNDVGLPAGLVVADPVRSFYGKAIAKIAYFWFVYMSEGIASARKASFDAFMSLILRTAELGQSQHDRDVYYSERVAQLVA